MEKAIYIQLNIYAFLVCLLLFLHQRKTKQDILGKHEFEVLTLSMMAIQLLNICSWILEGNVFKGSDMLYLVELHLHFAIQIFPNSYLLMYCIQSGRKKKQKEIEVALWIGIIAVWLLLTGMNVVRPYLFYIDSENVYHRLSAFYPVTVVLTLLTLTSTILCIYQFFKSKKTRKVYLHLLVVTLMTILGGAIQIMIYSLEVASLAVTLSFVYLYIFVQSERDDALQQQLSEEETNALLSQIQPHFLYNAVGTIQHYCEEDPELAKDAVNQFATFLRGNLDSVMSRVPIYFEDEMKHVYAYLYLEKLRKQDNLKIEYQIEEKDFFLPALTIQPIVENAVKYGVASREQGGTVTISTRKEEQKIIITVADDGIGMDVERIEDIPVKKDGRTHLGLLNVKNRLRDMVDGTIEIHSTKTEGTSIRVIIPCNQIQNEECR